MRIVIQSFYLWLLLRISNAMYPSQEMSSLNCNVANCVIVGQTPWVDVVGLCDRYNYCIVVFVLAVNIRVIYGETP